MMRLCDGSDPNLTREVPAAAYNPVTETVSPNWDKALGVPGVTRIICCNCGLEFNDEDRMVIYPHQYVHGGSGHGSRAA
jgi:hypothetical protein